MQTAKPECLSLQGNVLLSNNGGVQLADFGNAVLASSALLFTESSSTRSGFSVRWAAPEQLQAEVAYSREADIYSLGMTILEIISRQQPYAYIPNEAAVVAAILIKRQRPKRPEDMIPTNSHRGDALWSLLESCWSWDPKDRPEAPSVVRKIETIKPKGLLAKRKSPPETSASSASPSLALGSNTPETKRRPESLERQQELRNKRLQPETDKSVQIPKAHQYLISKAKDILDDVVCREGQEVDSCFINFVTPKLEYGADDLMDLLSEIHKLGINTPETAQLELLSKRVDDFQQKARRLLLELKPDRNPDEVESLNRLEIAIGQGLWLQRGKLPELERTVASLGFSRELQTVNLNGLTPNQVEELLLRGQVMGVSPDHRIMAELARKATSGRQWNTSATSILAQPQPEMEALNQLLDTARSVPTLPDTLGQLTRVWLRGREYEKQVEACLRPPEGTLVQIDDAINTATTALDEVYFPAAEELRALSDEARTWEKICEEIVTGGFKMRGKLTVLNGVRSMRDEGEVRFWAFHMPRFEEVITELAIHDNWISRLPWTRPGLSAPDLANIVRDVTGDVDAESAPPTNEASTCICVEPVVVGESGQDTEVARCDHCLVSFHAKCIEGWCPFCDDQTWNRSIGERSFRLQHLNLQYETACELTQHYSLEYRALRAILSDNGESALTKPIIRFIKQLTRQDSPDSSAIPQIRHLIRRLYGIKLEISARPEMFAYGLALAHLHRQMAIRSRIKQMARRKPKFVFKSEMEPKAEDGSRCLCSGTRLNWAHQLCGKCRSVYHAECIALSSIDRMPQLFVCPLCLLKEGESYEPAEVRVTYQDDDPEEDARFVDVKACLDKYSWRVIRRTLPAPVRTTITVELFLFIPGTNPNVKEL
ncbi:hypothetical protein FRC09_019225 [Ceratobasidium sp. 395]|nr:hypothetical protein FRC09_019225 [Ceratobasidium sp. 395]